METDGEAAAAVGRAGGNGDGGGDGGEKGMLERGVHGTNSDEVRVAGQMGCAMDLNGTRFAMDMDGDACRDAAVG